jgi:hypothetical protein
MVKRASDSNRSNIGDVLSVRLTSHERQLVQREARARGATVAGFVRTLLMDHIQAPRQRSVTLTPNTHTGTFVRVYGDIAADMEPPKTASAT